MIKNVMVTENKELKLDELFREAWKGNIMLNDYNWTIFVSNLGNKVKVQKGGLLGSSKVTDDDRFEVEVKTKITEKTVFLFLITIHKSRYEHSEPYSEQHYGQSILDVVHTDTIQVLAYVDDGMQVVWERI